MDSIQEVDIESDGVFKYILIKLTDRASTHERTVVRGYKWAEYHGNFFDMTRAAPPLIVLFPVLLWIYKATYILHPWMGTHNRFTIDIRADTIIQCFRVFNF